MTAIRRRRGRLASVTVLVLVALAIIGRGAFASFVGSATATHATSLATMQLTIGGNTLEDDEFSLPASDVVAGDTIVRTLTLTPTGTVAPTEVDVSTTATTSSLLDTDTANGLFTAIFTCSVPFDQSIVGGIPLITGCTGDFDNPIPLQPVIIGATPIPGIDLTPGTPTYIAIAVGLGDADTSFESLTSVIRYTFTAVQPLGGAK